MNYELTKRWNAKVDHDDTVVVVGDFTFKDARKYLPQLNGKKILVVGNHDHKPTFDEGWSEIHDIYNAWVHTSEGKKLIVCCHYAMRTWDQSHKGSWHLYGHTHGNLPDDPNSLSFDVGVDCHNYEPLTLEEVERIMKRKKWQPPTYMSEAR